MSTFICYYCGDPKLNSDASDEHIIPSCIGGNRNVTLTDQVCRGCNERAGREVDHPFGRDWLIAAMRFIAGVSHRGKPPMLFRGRLDWSRHEVVRVFEVAGGGTLLVIETLGETVLGVIATPNQLDRLERVIKSRFGGMRVINRTLPRRTYDDELIGALDQLALPWRLRFDIDLSAWHRAIVKIALGLACQTFGAPFVVSSAAAKLRTYLWEQDPARRNALGLRGRGGPLVSTPTLTSVVHPGGYLHLFELLATGSGLGLAANFFGSFENIVRLDDGESFAAQLPLDAAGVIRGVGWIVDPVMKRTTGPTSVSDLIASSVNRERARPADAL